MHRLSAMKLANVVFLTNEEEWAYARHLGRACRGATVCCVNIIEFEGEVPDGTLLQRLLAVPEDA